MDFQIESVFADSLFDFPEDDPRTFIRGLGFDFSIKVQNRSSRPISSFGTYIPYIVSFCLTESYFQKIDTLMEVDETLTFKGQIPYFDDFIKLGDSIDLCLSVLAPNGEWESDLSQNTLCAVLTTDQLTVSIEKELQSQFSIYPNPVENTLNLSFESVLSDEINVKLFSLQGAMLMENTFRSPYMTLPMDRFRPGIYLLEVQMGSNRFWQKIVKE